MELTTIENEEQYDLMLEWIDAKFDEMAAIKKFESDKITIALELVKAYENDHYPFPDPIITNPDAF